MKKRRFKFFPKLSSLFIHLPLKIWSIVTFALNILPFMMDNGNSERQSLPIKTMELTMSLLLTPNTRPQNSTKMIVKQIWIQAQSLYGTWDRSFWTWLSAATSLTIKKYWENSKIKSFRWNQLVLTKKCHMISSQD